MKKDWAMLAGWGAGIFAAATVALLTTIGFSRGRMGDPEAAIYVLVFVILAAGPGFLVLSLYLSHRLKQLREGRSRGATLALGALVGGFLGPLALLITPILFFGHDVLAVFSRPFDPEALLTLAMGVLGGAAAGFTCAWRLTAAPKEDA